MEITPTIDFEPTAHEGIQSILSAAGLAKTSAEKAESEKGLTEIQKRFEDHGAGMDACASKVAELMDSNKAEVALRATETALKVMGVFSDKDKIGKFPVIQINVHNSHGGEQKNLINLIMPAAQ